LKAADRPRFFREGTEKIPWLGVQGRLPNLCGVCNFGLQKLRGGSNQDVVLRDTTLFLLWGITLARELLRLSLIIKKGNYYET